MHYGIQEGVSIKELSRQINVSLTTLRTWESYFNIPVARNEKNERRYTENIVNIFQEIKRMTTEGHSLQQVKTLLNQETAGNGTHQQFVEVIQGNPEEPQQNFELIIKPFLKEIERKNKELDQKADKIDQLLDKNAKLTAELEFMKLKYESKKWWNFWKK